MRAGRASGTGPTPWPLCPLWSGPQVTRPVLTHHLSLILCQVTPTVAASAATSASSRSMTTSVQTAPLTMTMPGSSVNRMPNATFITTVKNYQKDHR